jgi:hypothetical protein
MAATGFTPIQLYRTATAAAVPVNTNLADGELAINTTDEKLYFKNAAGTVKLLAANITPVSNGGTGAASLTANNVILGNGTSAVQVVAPGTAGNVLLSNGTTWTSGTATGAPLNSPAFTGIPTAPTAAFGTNTTQIATTEFVMATVPAFSAF